MKYLIETAHSLWMKFESEVKHNNRYIIKSEFLKYFDKLCKRQNNIEIAEPGRIYYRARIVNELSKINPKSWDDGFYGFSKEECLAPPPDKAKSGRANPKYISYLYLGEDEKTALAEVRPYKKQHISIAKIKNIKELKLFCFRFIENDISNRHYDKQLMSWISLAYALPVNNDEEINYFPTQYLAEYIKNKGFDGFKYDSSLLCGGTNVTLFDQSNVEALNSKLYMVQRVEYYADEVLPRDNDNKIIPKDSTYRI